MDRRWNLLWIVPLVVALVVFLLTQNAIFTALGLVAGMMLMWAVRRLMLPPHVHDAIRLFQKGDLESAVEAANQAASARPDRWEPYYVRSLIHFAFSQLEAAEDDARRSIELNPNSSANHAMLGRVLSAQANFAAARQAYASAVELNGRDANNQYHLAVADYRLGHYEGAGRRLELATRLGIENEQQELLAYYYLARCQEEMGDPPDSAIERMREKREALQGLRNDLGSVSDFPARTYLMEDIDGIETLI